MKNQPSFDFEELRERLLSKNYQPRYVERTIKELKNHIEETTKNFMNEGVKESEAREKAFEEIGDLEEIADEIYERVKTKRPTKFEFDKFTGWAAASLVMTALLLIVQWTHVLNMGSDVGFQFWVKMLEALPSAKFIFFFSEVGMALFLMGLSFWIIFKTYKDGYSWLNYMLVAPATLTSMSITLLFSMAFIMHVI